MALKYQNEIDALGCSLESFSERDNRKAFRWIINNMDHPNNFLPRALIIDKEKTCGSWGLSFFETLKQSIDRLNHIVSDKAYLYKKLGNLIAEGTLERNDGLSEDCNEIGHFNHHEYVGIDLKSKFQIVHKVN